MKPSPEPIVAAVVVVVVMAAAVAVAAVVVVVTAAVVAVIATTIVTSANHAGKKTNPQITQIPLLTCVICGWIYFLASGVIFKVSFSVPRITSTVYSWPAFISPSAYV